LSYVQKNTYFTRIETDCEFVSLNVQQIKVTVLNINYFSHKRWPSNARFSRL